MHAMERTLPLVVQTLRTVPGCCPIETVQVAISMTMFRADHSTMYRDAEWDAVDAELERRIAVRGWPQFGHVRRRDAIINNIREIM